MPSSQHLQERLAEAARYALLRRLAPAIRHDMAGALQPISMMAAMLERRLQKPDPDLETLGKNASAISSLSREASTACISLMTWLAPKDNHAVAVAAGIEDAVSLLATELSFRGFTLLNETAGAQGELPRSVIRSVFMASLVALTDSAEGPANVVLTAGNGADGIVLTLTLVKTEGELMSGSTNAYRSLDWDDVEAIAEAETVRISRTKNRVELYCGLGAATGA